ncbi:hypothetical protein [Salmonella phage SD-6_S16]|nr:hypothetical protein [Salmonella phage SD-6_S16]
MAYANLFLWDEVKVCDIIILYNSVGMIFMYLIHSKT